MGVDILCAGRARIILFIELGFRDKGRYLLFKLGLVSLDLVTGT